MKVMLLQPLYLPWIGMFDMLDQCDLFVFYDDAQFVKQSWQIRNRIKTPYGVKWLTGALQHASAPLGTQIKEIRVNHAMNWVEGNLNQLKDAYREAPHFTEIYEEISAVLLERKQKLIDTTIPLIMNLTNRLGIHTSFQLSSELDINGRGTERVIEICRRVGASVYLDGRSGKELYDPSQFLENGVEIQFHDFIHPRYPQLHGEFVSHLSIVDLLFNVGDEALSVIRAGRVHA